MPTVYRNLFAMGTRFDMVLPGIEEDLGDLIFSHICKEIFRLEEMLSNYNDLSVLSQLNKTATNSLYYADNEMFNLILSLKELNKKSLGFFNVTVSRFIDSKTGIIKENHGPNSEILSMNDIIINSDDASVKFAGKEIAIDSGGFGKGYTMEKIKNILLDQNILQAFISFGESSVLVLGNHPFGEGWKVSIPDFYSTESVYVFHLKNNALSVSGNTPANRNKYPQGHIADPFTGVINKKSGIVCVSGPSAFESEILSTALFAAGEKEQIQILKNFIGYEAVSITYAADHKNPLVKKLELL
jgi:thiamine biosynthesis lipoprotein